MRLSPPLLRGAAVLFLAGGLSCSLAPAASARHYYSWEKKPEKSFLIRTRTRWWMTATSAQVRSSMVTPAWWWIPPADNISIGQTDDFKVMDAALPLFSAEFQPLRGFSLEFETADNAFRKGKYFEHDWLHATNRTVYLLDGVVWDSPQHRDYAKKQTETAGTARQYSAAAYLTVYKTDGSSQDGEFELAHSLDLFVGYSWYETKARLFNGYKIMSTDFFLPTPPPGPMVGLDSTARMAWYGWRGGARERVSLGKGFSGECRLGFGPAMKFRGENFWNLEPSLANPGERTEAAGQLLEFSAEISWRFWRALELSGGWMSWSYTSGGGRRTVHYADGTSLEGDLNKVKATRKGFYLGLGWKY